MSQQSEIDGDIEKKVFTTDMIMNVLCTFNQEGLGPIKWWEN